jgi:exonuclease VII small subunit
LRACIRQLDKGEEELDKTIEVYKNASWRTPMKDPTKKPKEPSESPCESPSESLSGKKLDAALTQYKEAENSGTFCKEHLDNVLSQYSEDVAGELSSSILLSLKTRKPSLKFLRSTPTPRMRKKT